LGRERAILAIVLAGALLTYGGVSLFVAAFVVVPVAEALFQEADVPRRLIPASVALGAFSFTMTALPGTPAIQNAIPMPYFGTTPFAAPGLGLIAAAIMLAFGLWWLKRVESTARRAGEGYGSKPIGSASPDDQLLRERAVIADTFDPAEVAHGHHDAGGPRFWIAVLPMLVVIATNFSMSMLVLPHLDTEFR
jgi:H+/gluconate symporter-like permease